MQLRFHGAVGGEVTGSCYHITVGNRQLLVDCGLIQGRPQDELRNREPFPFDIASIDAVILTHAHLDHSGRLPLLVRNGYQGPIYAHEATRDLCRIMLRDAAFISEKEAEWENRKRERKGLKEVSPLYTLRDAEATMAQFRPLAYNRREELLPGVGLQLQDAGHILGASILELWLQEGELRRKVIFSGDLGHSGAPVMRDPARIEEADLVVMESTYGDRLHRGWQETWQELTGIIEDATAHGGNILIPSFAVGRTQDLLYAFARHFDEWQLQRWSIFLDSPLAIEATEVYRHHVDLLDVETRHLFSNSKPFSLPNLHISRRAEESMAINQIRSGAIVIAGSGMCDGGRIKHHFKHNIWRRNTHIIIVGFQVQGTLGRALVDGARHIRLWGETVKVAAKIHTLGGFSAHADHEGLLSWYGAIKGRPPVILTHGEDNARHHMQTSLRQRLHAEVFMPVGTDRFDLQNLNMTKTAH
jgi:metallo-beta-lactamase family protein